MKYRFLSLLEDLLIIVLNFIVVLSFWRTFFWSFQMDAGLLKTSLFIIVPLVYYVVRKYVKHIALFTLIHLLIVFLYAWFVNEGLFNKVTDIIVLFALSLHSFIIRIKRSEPGEKPISPIAAGVFLVLQMFLLSYLGFKDKLPELFKLGVTFAFLYFPILYIKRFKLSDFYNKKIVEDVPTKKILKTGAPYVGIMMAVYAVVSLICINENLVNTAKNFLKKVIGNILYYLIRFIMLFSGKEKELPEATEQMPQENPLLMLMEEDKGPSKIAMIIEQIIMYAVLALFVGAVLFSLFKFIIEIIRRFKGIDNSKFVDFSTDYKEEREAIKREKKKAFRPERLTGYSGKIRKLYIKLLEKSRVDRDQIKTLTVRDFSSLYEDEKREDALNFALIYEKARYSNQACTKADVLLAKHLCEKLI
ncbi:MAG: hypothetical protein J6X48_07690 [Lachnospiraceae bacterium]|nr:hypothetical protein [Lachnospiraceae bacterium]